MKEKMIELLMQKGFGVEGATIAADHLIANGVTIPVYCKECKHYFHYGDGVYGCRTFGMMKTKLDGFCSYGKRRTDGKRKP